MKKKENMGSETIITGEVFYILVDRKFKKAPQYMKLNMILK